MQKKNNKSHQRVTKIRLNFVGEYEILMTNDITVPSNEIKTRMRRTGMRIDLFKRKDKEDKNS